MSLAVVTTDSYNYFGRDPAYLDERLLPFVKPGGYIYIAIPGMKQDCHDNLPPELLLSWTPEQMDYMHDTASLICNIAVYWRSHSRIDDALDVFPTHGTGGIFGTLLTGIFIQEGLIAGTWDGFVIFLFHLLAIIIVFVYTFSASWLGYKLIDSVIPMRVSSYSEKVGLDFSQHDEHYGLAHIGERELAEYEEHIREKEKTEA